LPEIGDTTRGFSIGIKTHNLYTWQPCKNCGKLRWVQLNGFKKGLQSFCISCSAKNNLRSFSFQEHPNWKGGRYKTSSGYIMVKLTPGDFFYPMAKKVGGYVLEHRLVMAKHLCRCLLPWEVVHHKNGNGSDNRLENLMLFPHQSQHVSDSLLKKRLGELESRVTLLEAENILLKEQLSPLTKHFV
jgi:hypothetical protein